MISFTSLVLFLMLARPSLFHSIEFQVICPPVDEKSYYFESFDMDKFLGKWYIIAINKAQFSSCMALDFEKKGNGDFRIEEGREFKLLKTADIEFKTDMTGTLTVPVKDKPAVMEVSWPGFFKFLGLPHYVVVDTDYDGYALIVECIHKSYLGGALKIRRSSAAILSRNTTLDQTTDSNLRDKVKDLDLDWETLNYMDHSNCLKKGEGTFHVNIPEVIF